MARRTDASAATIGLVRERDDHRCARCAGWGPLTTQHRRARGMGGSRLASINEPDNLLTLCGSGTTGCHGWVEAHPGWAREHGYSVSFYGQPPAQVPVWTWRGWVLLLTSGDMEPITDHKGVPNCPCGCSVHQTTGAWVPA